MTPMSWIVVLVILALPLHAIAVAATIFKAIKGRSIKNAVADVWAPEADPFRPHAANFFHPNGCDCDGCTGIDSAMMERYYNDLYYKPDELTPAELREKIVALRDVSADTLACEADGPRDCCSIHRQLERLTAREAANRTLRATESRRA